MGHFVISSGHSNGALDAGASQCLRSKPHTEPDIRPLCVGSPIVHFFVVDTDFYSEIFDNVHVNYIIMYVLNTKCSYRWP